MLHSISLPCWYFIWYHGMVCLKPVIWKQDYWRVLQEYNACLTCYQVWCFHSFLGAPQHTWLVSPLIYIEPFLLFFNGISYWVLQLSYCIVAYFIAWHHIISNQIIYHIVYCSDSAEFSGSSALWFSWPSLEPGSSLGPSIFIWSHACLHGRK